MQNPKLFEQQCRKAEEYLHTSNDLKSILKQSLNLAVTLTHQYSLKDYSEIYSSFLIYIRVLHRLLSNKTKFPQNLLVQGYLYSMRFPLVLPRLYISMIISCLIEDTSYLKSVCAMFPSVSHPLRGLMLRFTAISFFPHNSVLLVPFTVTNFNEMMYLINGFLELFPDEIQTASEWIASNISISLTIVSDSLLINHYIDEAISCNYEELGAASINSVVLSIPKPSFAQYLPKLKQYFLKARINELNIKSVSAIIANLENSKIAYDFVKSVNYEEQCSLDLALVSLEQKDYETLSKLEQTDEVLILILEEAGPEVFSDLAKPLPRGHPITKEFIKRLKPSVDPRKARKILQNEIQSMDSSVYELISQVVQFYHFPKEFYEIFFASPFAFQSSDLLTYVIMQGHSTGINIETLISYIRVSKTVSAPHRASNMCYILKGPELVFYCLGLENERARKILIHSLDSSYSKDMVIKIFEKCNSISELVLLFEASTIYNDKALSEAIIRKLIEKDGEIESQENQLKFYFISILNTLFGASSSSLPVFRNTVEFILSHILKALISAVEIPFPITTPENTKIWSKIIDYGLTLKTMEPFQHILTSIKELIPSIS